MPAGGDGEESLGTRVVDGCRRKQKVGVSLKESLKTGQSWGKGFSTFLLLWQKHHEQGNLEKKTFH